MSYPFADRKTRMTSWHHRTRRNGTHRAHKNRMGSRRTRRTGLAGVALALALSACHAAPTLGEAAADVPARRAPPAASVPELQDSIVQDGTCVVGTHAARPCRIEIKVDGAGGARRVRFSMSGQSVEFIGHAQGPWWSGTLDGRPAMGYELNRGHVVYSTRDLDPDTLFEWWSPGMEHGTY